MLTHCNAGWLATVDWGTALAPIYKAHRAGIPVHVWVDETRPRNQGASLTAWELNKEGVPHTVIADNTGGHLMQHGMVDLCIVGTDRTTRSGDVANKIGTYLKALAAHDNGVPFYVALPSSTIDWRVRDGVKEIPIEERGAGRGHAPDRRDCRRRDRHDPRHAGGKPGGELCVRRDAGAARHRASSPNAASRGVGGRADEALSRGRGGLNASLFPFVFPEGEPASLSRTHEHAASRFARRVTR